MKFLAILPMSGCVLLAACGGGGGVASTPAPPSAPTPTPTNTSMADLRYDQVFSTTGASATTSIDLTQALVTSANTAPSTVQVRYDAASKSYTVEGPGRSQSFTPADIQTNSADETLYRKTSDGTTDYLTLVNTPYTTSTQNQYVRLGYWQRNRVTAGVQDTSFDSFVYGLATPAGAMPRTGTAGYLTDTLGFVTNPGKAPRAFTGMGTFNVDLGLGLFSANSSATEYDLVTGESVSGGGIEFAASGHLTGNGFSGIFTYGGWDGREAGTIAGRFFGPAAQELGASFSATNPNGGAVTGSVTGRSSATLTPVNMALTKMLVQQRFYTAAAQVSFDTSDDIPFANPSSYLGGSSLVLNPDGSFAVSPPLSNLPYNLNVSAADAVASGDANFAAYRKTTSDGSTVDLKMYKVGGANSELALTYTNFGTWHSLTPDGYFKADTSLYFLYGLETPDGALAARTGSARYSGVAYGAGVNRASGAAYDVTGSSSFDINFGSQSYSGALVLAGADRHGGARVDFGSYGFNGALGGRSQFTAQFLTAQAILGNINGKFYGPDGEEIGASFSLVTTGSGPGAGTQIAGVAAARRQ